MKMQALVALRGFPYGGKNLKAGQLFHASLKDARILIALRRAQVDPAGAEVAVNGAVDSDPRALVQEAMSSERPRRRHTRRKSESGSDE